MRTLYNKSIYLISLSITFSDVYGNEYHSIYGGVNYEVDLNSVKSIDIGNITIRTRDIKTIIKLNKNQRPDDLGEKGIYVT